LRPGKDNLEADALSRAPLDDNTEDLLFEEATDDVIPTPIFAVAIGNDLRRTIILE